MIHKKAGHEIILKRLLTPCEGITDINFPLIVFFRSLTIMRFSKSDFYLVFYPEFCQAIHVTNMLLLRKKKKKSPIRIKRIVSGHYNYKCYGNGHTHS